MSTPVQDNLDPVVENQDPTPSPDPTPAPTPESVGPTFTWKNQLSSDLQGSPTLQKFEDTQEGLHKAVESHLSLEKLLGHEKVPIPKGEDDVEGWNRFNKAMGIPDKGETYGLSDAEVPDTMKGLVFDKKSFADISAQFKLTPKQAKGLWGMYTEQSKGVYAKAQSDHKAMVDDTVNRLRGEWGDAYDVNIELGQTVINKFAGDQETVDFLTATIAKDPRSVKFLAKIGNQFAENKIGEFQYKRFSKAPDEAKAEWDAVLADPKHPYHNPESSEQERTAAIAYVNRLIAVATGQKG